MATSGPGPCPVCNNGSTLTSSNGQYGYTHEVNCPRCGKYFILDIAKDEIQRAFGMDPRQVEINAQRETPSLMNKWDDIYIEVAKKGIQQSRSIISHVLRESMIKRVISLEDLFNILKNYSLPTPAEQANNLILFLGDNLYSPGDMYVVFESNPYETKKIYGLIGVQVINEASDLHFLIRSLREQNMIYISSAKGSRLTRDGEPIPQSISLTFQGWQKYEELKRSVKDSRKAFMAMDFVDPDNKDKDYFFQEHLFPEYLIPAVQETDYELSNPLASEPKAGNIHARLEVEMRASRFVVAELSHNNSGAYWEAGFARGLGKPVIYMYNKEIGGPRPHFDVGSDQIVFWKKEEPEEAAKALKGVIRATLFGEAKMED